MANKMASPPVRQPSLVTSDIDFARPGSQHGHLYLPYSRNDSAYGRIPFPITVINGGPGPSILMTAGNHGDEFEGVVALSKLSRVLAQTAICGRLIIIPTLNMPAALDCSRNSPIDGGNLNRSFPGRRDGTITEMLAHYVETVLFPMAEIAIDLHSGGSSFYHWPTLLAAPPQDPAHKNRYMALVNAFAAPRTTIVDMLGEDRTYSAAAIRNGVWFLGGEFGGGAHCAPDSLTIVEDGLARLLHHLGVAPDLAPPPAGERTCYMKVFGRDHYVFAKASGVFESNFVLGQQVRRGDLAGYIHDLQTPWHTPEEVFFEGEGFVMCDRTYARVEPGDCIAMLASAVSEY